MRVQHTAAEYSLSEDEVRTIINNTKNFRDRCMIKCMYYAGMRVSEVMNLCIENINFERNTINIMNSKGNKTRTVPVINSDFLSDLKHLIGYKRAGRVFGVNRRWIQKIVKSSSERAKISNPNPTRTTVSPHVFRHSIARHLKNKGYPLEFIQKFLGHSSMMTTADVYGTLSLHEMQMIAAKRSGDHSIISHLKDDKRELLE